MQILRTQIWMKIAGDKNKPTRQTLTAPGKKVTTNTPNSCVLIISLRFEARSHLSPVCPIDNYFPVEAVVIRMLYQGLLFNVAEQQS